MNFYHCVFLDSQGREYSLKLRQDKLVEHLIAKFSHTAHVLIAIVKL